MPRRRRSRSELVFLCLALGCGLLGCRGDAPGNPMPPAEAITGAEFVYGPDTEAETRGGSGFPAKELASSTACSMAADSIQSRLGGPRRASSNCSLRGVEAQTYDIYWTGKDPGAYADHLRRYFRGGSDAAFAKFLNEVEQIETKR